MTGAEHLAWCKERAMKEFDYYTKNDTFEVAKGNAIASMLSDLGKHPETAASQQTGAMLMFLPMHTRRDIEKFINGFN